MLNKQKKLNKKKTTNKLKYDLTYKLSKYKHWEFLTRLSKKITKAYIYIKILQNNIFCTLKNEKQILISSSAGKYKIKVSKKLLKFASTLVITQFAREIKQKLKAKLYYIFISGPQKIRSRVLRHLKKKLKKAKQIAQIQPKKCFNGCRAPKKQRKKNKRIRIFKS